MASWQSPQTLRFFMITSLVPGLQTKGDGQALTVVAELLLLHFLVQIVQHRDLRPRQERQHLQVAIQGYYLLYFLQAPASCNLGKEKLPWRCSSSVATVALTTTSTRTSGCATESRLRCFAGEISCLVGDDENGVVSVSEQSESDSDPVAPTWAMVLYRWRCRTGTAASSSASVSWWLAVVSAAVLGVPEAGSWDDPFCCFFFTTALCHFFRAFAVCSSKIVLFICDPIWRTMNNSTPVSGRQVKKEILC
uniref:Uncharacterized protein n=1 Tax=Leersia perrieri TaxID=77586 RepID=A0A0D9XLZ3_9ORYZ